jgi:hypothetical protein
VGGPGRLGPVSDSNALERLLAGERQEWTELWQRVARLPQVAAPPRERVKLLPRAWRRA